MLKFEALFGFTLVVANFGTFAVFLHAPEGFQGLIPQDLQELNRQFTPKQEILLQEALLLLGEGQGDAVAFLKKHDPELARDASGAFTSVEKKLDKMSPESIKFIAQLIDYLRTSPDNHLPDKNGNPQVPKEVHEISLVASWAKLDSKTRAEVQSVFPSIAKTLRSAEFKEHAQTEMQKHGWSIN